ncbi:MAG: 2-C-methyl-D-erythritol 4-phosphate cytidylyltransferase [Candidatus Cloacimonetes bacterium HGW-Cloacimonetes-1]|jgi:2-C-methyl-D-erythritol 4-phosphate cytidylyltransferase|nr:MAG: 2-C-methyl-D-erythritol 4-phosphate cytidylyltransferase [Candidatus Cloacimonetes bacterium HGW-Cloacimonetes-1]
MDSINNSCAIITAAGSGTRLAGDTKKQFLELGGIPILIRTAGIFFNSPHITNVIITAPEEDLEYCKGLMLQYFENVGKPYLVLAGGVERQDSIFGALQRCKKDTDYVFIHDAVRPFITQDLIDKLYEAVVEFHAVVPASPCKNTIKSVIGDTIEHTLDRKSLIQVFTPQVFDFKLLLNSYIEAYQKELFCTDDAQIVEATGYPVRYLLASDLNIKITDETDMFFAQQIIDKNMI